MKIKLVEPKHRCLKCNIPLKFDCYKEHTDEEIKKITEEKYNKLKWWQKFGHSELVCKINSIDNENVEVWKCPKCYEHYEITIDEDDD